MRLLVRPQCTSIVDLRAAAQKKAYTEISARRRTLLLQEVFLGGFIRRWHWSDFRAPQSPPRSARSDHRQLKT